MVRTGRLPLLLVLLGLAVPVGRASGQQPEPPPLAPLPVRPEPPAAAGAPAAPPVEAPAPAPAPIKAIGKAAVGKASLVQLIRQANPMLWPLALCSVVALAYALERLVALRWRRVVPRDFVDRFLDRLASGKLDRDRAAELCRANESVAARIFGRIVQHWGQPAQVIREVVAVDAAGELLDLRRNVRVLNGTATLAPLLGLLGTVIGMIESFDSLSGDTGGIGKNEALAHGISLALMATAFGLAIAIVSVAAYYYLLNRIDTLVRALNRESGRVIDLVAGDAPANGVPYAELRRGAVGPADLARHEVRGL